MQFKTADLRQAVAHCAAIVNNKDHFTEARCLRLDLYSNGVLCVEGANREISTRIRLNASERVPTVAEVTTYKYAVNAVKLKKILQSLPASTVDVAERGPGSLQIGKLKIESEIPDHLKDYGGINGLFETLCTQADCTTMLHSAAFTDFTALERVLVAASTDETRYNLVGINMDPARSVLVATDGHRLHLAPFTCEPRLPADLKPMILPSAAIECLLSAKALSKSSWTVSFCPKDSLVLFAADNHSCEVAFKTIDGEFPDYSQVIPKASHRKAEMSGADRQTWIAALKEVIGVAKAAEDKDATFIMRFGVCGTLCVHYKSTLGDWSDSVSIAGCTYNLTIGARSHYLLDYFENSGSGSITIELPEYSTGPVKLVSAHLEAIIMPIRLVNSGEDRSSLPGYEYYYDTVKEASDHAAQA